MSLIECFDRARVMGVITAEDAASLRERFREIAKETANTAEARERMRMEIEGEAQLRHRRALLTEIARTRILDEMAAHRNERGEVDELEAWIAMHENFGRIGGYIKDAENARDAIVRMAQANLQSLMQQGVRAEYGNMASGALAARMGNARSTLHMKNMIRELFGEATGDPTAKAMAAAWEKVSDDLRVRFNAAGGSIGKLSRWGMTQRHDHMALLDFGRDAWVRHMMGPGVLDRARTVHTVTRKPLSDADLRRALEQSWDEITSDGGANRDVTARPDQKGVISSQHLDHRFLHFASADSWLAYADRFGTRDPYAAIMGHVSTMARDIAHMERFGPNANALRTYIQNHLLAKAASQRPTEVVIRDAMERVRELQEEAGPIRTIDADLSERATAAATAYQDALSTRAPPEVLGRLADSLRDAENRIIEHVRSHGADESRSNIGKKISAIFNEMRQPIVVKDGVPSDRILAITKKRLARADAMWEQMRGVEVDDAKIAARMQSARNFITGTALGSAWLSSLNDPAFGQDARMRLGMSFAKANFGRLIVTVMRDMITRGSREDLIDAGLGLDSAMQVLRRQAREVDGVDHRYWTGVFAQKVLTWGLLAPWTQAGKHAFGRDFMGYMGDLSTQSFDQLSPMLQTAMRSHGFGPDEWNIVRAVPLHQGRRLRPKDVIAVAGRDLGERYLAMIMKESRYAVPEGTVRSRSIMMGGTKPGTIVGEMIRSAGQFKSFGVTVIMLHAGRIAREIQGGDTRNAVTHGASLIVTSVFLGAVAMALKDMKDGRDPRKWLDEKTWLDWKHWGAALLQSGGLGIYGDLLFSDANRFGGGLESTIAGPLAGRVSDVGDLIIGEPLKALKGQKTTVGRSATKLARRNVPFTNMWFTSVVYQRAVMDALQRMADPEGAAALRREETKRLRDYGQGYWYPPGSPAPRRAPDLSRIISTR